MQIISVSPIHQLRNDMDLFLPTSGDRLSYGAMVERRDGPSWLRDDDDDDDDDDYIYRDNFDISTHL